MAEQIDPLRRLPWVLDMTGLPKSTLYDYIKKELFPKPKKLGPRSVAWPESVIAAWNASRPEAGATQ